jgi:hypothetical protein
LNIKAKDHGKGKRYNRDVNNKWNRNLVINWFKNNIKDIKEINPAYSSYIGNLQHSYVDQVNSSIEVARRGYQFYIKKLSDTFYPKYEVKDSRLHHWKEMDLDNHTQKYIWMKCIEQVKNSKMGYRVPLKDVKYPFNVFKLKSYKSKVKIIDFYRV